MRNLTKKPLDKRYLLLLLAIIPVFLIAFAYENNTLNISESATIQDSLSAQVVKPQGIERGMLIGHVTFELKDKDGNVKLYTQGDNTIVNNGENCLMKLMFGRTGGDESGNAVCKSTLDSGFRYIALEESATAVAEDDKDLNDPADSAGLATPLWGTASWTNSTGTSSSASVDIAATFTNSGAAETITGAGLFNATGLDTRSMVAHKLAASSATVDNLDTLTVTWTMTFAGA